MAIFSIRNFAIKQLMKRGDDGIMKMPSNMKADFAEAMLTKQLIDAGIDPRTIKNEQQMINVLDGIDNMKKQMATKEKTGITSAKIMDMEGKEIPKGSKIMGGKAVDDDLPPPGSRGGKDDIAAPVQSAEKTLKNITEAELREKLIRENKEAVARIKNKKLIDDAIDNVSIGFSGDRRTDAELVAAEIAERRGLNVDDLSTRERAKIYGEAYEALTKKKFDPDNMAQGGRVGLKDGMDRRTFMKVMAGLASIPVVGKFFKGAKVASKAAPVVKEAVTSGGTPPPYFFNLVKKIKNLGDDVTPNYAVKERDKVTRYKDYELTEDLTTGEQTIQKKSFADPDEGFTYENKTEEVYMNYKPGKGQADEATGKVADEYTEDTSYIRTSGPQKGDVYDTVEGVQDEVIQEGTMFEDDITDFATKKVRTKKAGGGVAYMLGQ